MSVAHIMAAGMGGMRTAGDLVAWMQLTRKMKITEAKKFVAQKLGIDIVELADEEVMNQIRKDLDIGSLPLVADGATGIIAKARIAELLEIKINSVDIFKSKLNLSGSSMGVARP